MTQESDGKVVSEKSSEVPLSLRIDELVKLNSEYDETHNFTPRKKAYEIWNTMTPDERQEMCKGCSKSERAKNGRVSRPRKTCYHCEAGSNFSKAEITLGKETLRMKVSCQDCNWEDRMSAPTTLKEMIAEHYGKTGHKYYTTREEVQYDVSEV